MKRKTNRDAKFIFQNSKRDWPNLVILTLLKIIMIYCNFQYPIIQSLIVDHGLNFQPGITINNGIYEFFFSGKFGADGSLSLIATLAVAFFIVILITNLCNYFIGSLTTLFKGKNTARLREKTFQKFCKCNANYNNGELMVLLNEDVSGLADFLYTSIPAILADLFTLFMAIFTLSGINPYLLIVPLIVCPILLTVCVIYINKLYNSQLTIREESAQIKSLLQGSIDGMKTIRLLNRTDLSRQRFKKKNVEYTTSIADKNSLTNKFNLIFNTIKKVAYIVSIGVGGVLAIKRIITIGQMLVFTTFVSSLLDSVTTICGDIANSKLYILQNRKLQAFLEAKDDIEENENAVELSPVQIYDLTFSKVSIDLQDKKVLSKVSINVPKGKSLGIIGKTGEGKSALVKCLLRLLEYKGKIEIGGIDIKNLSINNLRNLISYHTQNPSLFNMTLRENLLYSGREATDKEIKAVLKSVYADYILNDISLNYLLTDCGNMFGENKNRLSIARAMLKQAPIYIFDNFTYGYTRAERKTLCKNILEKLPNKNCIFVSNSFEDVKHCDLILKIADGKIEYFGEASMFNEKAGGEHNEK